MSIYRASVWFVRGLREFTKSGYQKAAKNFQPGDLEVDASNLSFMITGANSGIGKVTAIEVAKKGGTVHMVCRSEERAEAAKREIVTECGHENVHVHIVDMSKPKDVIKFCKEFIESGKQLDVLVNNAGCLLNERQQQEDGLEVNFATNSLGTYLMTKELLPVLEKSSKPRVVVVSSGGMYLAKLDPDDLNLERMRNFDGSISYAQNKVNSEANIVGRLV